MSIPLAGYSAWFIVLGSGLQQVTMGPRSLTFLIKGGSKQFPTHKDFDGS